MTYVERYGLHNIYIYIVVAELNGINNNNSLFA